MLLPYNKIVLSVAGPATRRVKYINSFTLGANLNAPRVQIGSNETTRLFSFVMNVQLQLELINKNAFRF